ncbi:MAG: efflux RND transporter permease subunit [Verrucomicrobiales bacterium]
MVGLVTKELHPLAEFANQEREKGLDAVTAMMNAGRIRLRPILMTTVSPPSPGFCRSPLDWGAAEGRRPLGVVAVGGMLTNRPDAGRHSRHLHLAFRPIPAQR